VPRNEGGRALVLGTATGVRISVDEGASWRPMSDKLLAVPHSVLFTDGLTPDTSAAPGSTASARRQRYHRIR